MVVNPRIRRWERLAQGKLTLKTARDYYQVFNRTEGKSPKTVRWYEEVLARLERYLVETGSSTLLADIGEPQVRGFILHLQQKSKWDDNPYVPTQSSKLSPFSVQTYVRAFRAFFNWLYREGYTKENRLSHLKAFKVPQRVVQVLTPEEERRVVSCINTNTCLGSRNLALLLLFLDTGLRASEPLNLRAEDTHMEEGYVKVMGKGAKERMVAFGGMTQRALSRYAYQCRPRPAHPGVDNFFLTADGYPMTTDGLKSLFQRLAQKSGVRKLHPHLLRHTFATNYLLDGGDVFTLQQILGHTSLEMVRKYVTLASAQVMIRQRTFSHVDKLRLGRHYGNNGNGRKAIPSRTGGPAGADGPIADPAMLSSKRGSWGRRGGGARVSAKG